MSGRNEKEEPVSGERDLLRAESVDACLGGIAALDRQAIGVVARAHGLDLTVLFGSTARGRRREGSDVDIAIQFAGPGPQAPTLEQEARASDALFRAL